MDGVQRIGICWSFPRDWPDLGAEAVGDDPTDYYTLTNCNENYQNLILLFVTIVMISKNIMIWTLDTGE